MRGLRDRRLTWRAFATDPCADLLRGQKTEYVPDSGNGNINITRIGDALVALGEVAMAVTFDPETLRATGWLDQAPEHGQGQRPDRLIRLAASQILPAHHHRKGSADHRCD